MTPDFLFLLVQEMLPLPGAHGLGLFGGFGGRSGVALSPSSFSFRLGGSATGIPGLGNLSPFFFLLGPECFFGSVSFGDFCFPLCLFFLEAGLYSCLIVRIGE